MHPRLSVNVLSLAPAAFGQQVEAVAQIGGPAIAEAGPRIALVQVSDYVYEDRGLPCRSVPGDGALPLSKLLDTIIESGFPGHMIWKSLARGLRKKEPKRV